MISNLEKIAVLKTFLESKNAKFYSPLVSSGLDWDAFVSLSGSVPGCNCNERPPSIHIHPCVIDFPNGTNYCSVEISLIAESKQEIWFDLKAYGFTPEDTEKKFDSIVLSLSKAWRAVYDVDETPFAIRE